MQLNHNKQLINLISVSITSTIRQVMQTIDKGGLGFALLIENETEKFVGVVTDGDIRRALLQGYGLESNISTIPRPESKTGHITISSEQITSLFSEMMQVKWLI
jgi:perosamine synthetase